MIKFIDMLKTSMKQNINCKLESNDLKYWNDSKSFIEYLNVMDDITVKILKNNIQNPNK